MSTLTETGRFVFRSLSEVGEFTYGTDDTIREKILDDIKQTLEQILIANGYDNDIQSVQRWKQHGNDLKNVPAIMVKAGPEQVIDNRFPLSTRKMTVFLDLWIREEESETNDTDEKLNTLLGDIQKAMTVDRTRGGFAVDTMMGSVTPFDVVEGEPHAGLMIETEIHYRTQQTDPKTAG